MECPDKWLYEYSVIRFVPRIDRDEFINIGLIMMCKRQKWLRGMISINEFKLQAISPSTDINCLKQQAAIFERLDLPFSDLPIEEKYRWLTATKSAMLQTSPSHPGIIISASSLSEFQTGTQILPISSVSPESSSKREAKFPSSQIEKDNLEILNKEFDRLFSLLVL